MKKFFTLAFAATGLLELILALLSLVTDSTLTGFTLTGAGFLLLSVYVSKTDFRIDNGYTQMGREIIVMLSLGMLVAGSAYVYFMAYPMPS